MRFRIWQVGVGVAVVLVVALIVALPRPAPSPSSAPLRIVFQPGDRQAYRLQIESVLRFAAEATGGPRTIRQQVSGTIHLRVLESGDGGARVALQLGEASLRLADQSSEELDRQIGQLFLATFAEDGAPIGFEFSAAIGEDARAFLREAVRTFQVIVPRGAGAAWTVDEEHATGRYRAAYRITQDGRLLKTKLAYLDEPGGSATGIRVSVRRADATVFIDPRASWLERMVVEEELAVSFGEGLFSSSSLTAELRRVPVETVAGLDIDEAPGSYSSLSAALAASASGPEEASTPEIQQARGLPEMVRGLEAPGALSVTLLYELRDLLIRDPGAAERVLAVLRTGVQDRTAAALLNALGMASTEESQAALRAVLDDPAFGRMNRARAALSLGGAPEIGHDSLVALRALADDPRAKSAGLADTAVLSLGMAGDTLRRAGSHQYDELRNDLVRRADGADGNEAATALLAIGNTHDAALAEEAATHLDDDSPAARSAAAHALGKLGGAAELDALVQRLAVEEHAAVRSTLATSLNALPPPSAEALARLNEIVARERDPQTRYEMARLLGENLERYPAARATLTLLSKQDPSKRIRTYASHKLWGRP